MNLAGRRVLLVGGAGYIGSVLAPYLVELGADVRILDALIYEHGYSLRHLADRISIEVEVGDMSDRSTLKRNLAGATDVVLLASLVGDPICRKYPELARQTNVDATRRLIEGVGDHGADRFVFLSTCSNYGLVEGEAIVHEGSPLNPQSLYAETKIEIEQFLLEEDHSRSFASTILRLATAYGLSPRMRFDLTVSQFAHEMATTGELLVYDADTWRPYCHVTDISQAVALALTSDVQAITGETFNVGTDQQQFTKRMLVDLLLAYLPDATIDYRAGSTDPRNYKVSFAKIVRSLGFNPQYSVEEHLPRLVKAIRDGVFPAKLDESFGNYSIS